MSLVSHKVSCFVAGMVMLVLGATLPQTAYCQADTAPSNASTSFTVNYLPYSSFINSTHEAPILKAKIGGRSYWFLLDTGASTSIIKESIAQETKLPAEEAPTIIGKSNLITALSFDGKYRGVLASTVTVGNAQLKEVPFYVAHDAALNAITDDDPSFAGIMGMNILEDFAVSIDFEHKEITFFPEGNLAAGKRAKAGFKADAIMVPLTPDVSDHRKYTFPLLCNKKPVSLFIDTGAAQTYIYKSASDFGVPASSLKEHVSYAIDGEQKSMIAIAPLSVAGTTVSDLQVGFRDGKSDAGDGMLGADFLSHYYVLLDFPGQKMYLRPRDGK